MACLGIQRGNERRSNVDHVPPLSNHRASAYELGSNPHSVALTPPQIKRPIAQVQPRLGGSDVTSRATEEPNSLSTLEASRRVLQYSLTAGFSELPNQISTYGLNGFHLRLISSQQILSPANRSNGY